MPKKYSFPKNKVEIVFLEGIHRAAVETFESADYSVRCLDDAVPEDDLIDIISSVHILGIRSRTKLTDKVLEKSKRLLAIGCYCIGTDQVDLNTAASLGVPVFNAPFSNTRSVAELTVAEVVMLARKASLRNTQLHAGKWRKSAEDCHEVRHKTIGIVGYGHIGPQVGLLAEGYGLKVVFYDIARKLPLGTAEQLSSLEKLLEVSDFVTLHVPETPETRRMIGPKELAAMKKGSCLLNLSRGSVVDIAALEKSLTVGHLAGAAIDVFPDEPGSNDEEFVSGLRGFENVILTPHIGGSTVEAQNSIGIEVSETLVKYTDTGSSAGAVNFPNVCLPVLKGSHRVLNIHRNVPGVLGSINGIVANMGANIRAQFLSTSGSVGYLIMDVGKELSRDVKSRIEQLEANIKTRLLF